MSFDNLINLCKQVVSTYNPVLDSPDTHFEKLFASNEDENESMFVQQVFYGCNRYKEFLKELIKAIFKVNVTTTNSNDRLPFTIFSYLALFRLDELGIDSFKRLVNTQEPLKMHVLLSFIFDAEMLRTHVREEWCKIYDYKFVDDDIIAKAEQNSGLVQHLLNSLQTKATGQSISKSDVQSEESKTRTVPQPFNLTKPRPRALPKPVIIEKKVKANPVDPRIFQTNLQALEQEKTSRRAKLVEETKNKYQFDKDPIKRLFAS